MIVSLRLSSMIDLGKKRTYGECHQPHVRQRLGSDQLHGVHPSLGPRDERTERWPVMLPLQGPLRRR
jgi:hypothetical protein